MGVAEPWDRGHGIVTVQFNAAGLKTLGLDPAQWSGNTSILYYQGPVQVRACMTMHTLPGPRYSICSPRAHAAVCTVDSSQLHAPRPFYVRDSLESPSVDDRATAGHPRDPHS